MVAGVVGGARRRRSPPCEGGSPGLIARGRQVKGIGASGESDLLDHFVFITVQRGHRATLEYDEEAYPLDTERVSDLARPLPPARFWRSEDAPQPTR